MEPANKNAWAMYIRTPFATSCRSKTCQAAMAIDDTMSAMAQAYWIDFSGFILEAGFCANATEYGGNNVGDDLQD